MPDVVLTKHRIEPGKTKRLRDWMAEIRERREEAIETLRSEGVHTESAFLERGEDSDYLCYYVECEDVQEMWAAFEQSDHDIDREHERVLNEVLADDADEPDIEPLYHLVNPER